MLERIVVLPDVHLTTKIPKPYQLAKKFIKDYKPTEIIILGDFMEVSSLSSYDLCKRRKIEGQRFEKEIAVAEKELSDLVGLCKRVTYLEGNHEERVERYLDDHPELEGILELPKRLKLAQKGIVWHKMNKLIKRGKLFFTHGVYYGKYFANKTVEDYGCSIVIGHAHRHQVATIYPKMQKHPMVCYALGCLGDTDPSYKKNAPTGHINQFCTCEVDTKTGLFNLYPITIINNTFIYNGKKYSLK